MDFLPSVHGVIFTGFKNIDRGDSHISQGIDRSVGTKNNVARQDE